MRLCVCVRMCVRMCVHAGVGVGVKVGRGGVRIKVWVDVCLGVRGVVQEISPGCQEILSSLSDASIVSNCKKKIGAGLVENLDPHLWRAQWSRSQVVSRPMRVLGAKDWVAVAQQILGVHLERLWGAKI